MLKKLNEIPPVARWLGFGGLLPFAATVLLVMVPSLDVHDVAIRGLLAYGAVILSFLGGVRWGVAIAEKTGAELSSPLTISVIPSIIGWAALLIPAKVGLTVLAMAFLAALIADMQLSTVPRWYRTLRLPLTLGALSALLIGIIF